MIGKNATGNNVQNNKKLHLEILRIVACFFVIFNHTGNDGFFLFSLYSPTSIQYWLYSFISVFCKFSVPLFFAISGALLLPKEEGIKSVYLKRVFRMALILFLISTFYYCFNNYFNFENMSVRALLGTMYVSTQSFHLWYLYAFIPFLMALPLLRPMARSLKNEHFLYMVICSLFFTAVLPIGEYLLWQGNHTLNSHFRMTWLTSNAVIYPFIGYYIENRMDVQRAKSKLLYLWIADIITIIISCVATYYRATVMQLCEEGSSQVFHSSFVLINLITIFITAKCLCEPIKIKPMIAKAIYSIGSCTFGIYLIHIAVMKVLYHYKVLEVLRKSIGINYMISCFLFCLITMLAGYALTLIAKKIPLLNRLL